jgi:hypothetical protein
MFEYIKIMVSNYKHSIDMSDNDKLLVREVAAEIANAESEQNRLPCCPNCGNKNVSTFLSVRRVRY